MPRQHEAVLDDFRDAVKDYPHLVWHHCLHSTRCEGSPGLADLIIIGPGGILFRECKPHPGAHPSPAQTAWKYAILGAGGDWALWTPQSVSDGTMAEDLRRAAAVPHVTLPRLGTPIRTEPPRCDRATETHADSGRADGRCECGMFRLHAVCQHVGRCEGHPARAGYFSLSGLPDYVAGSDAWFAARERDS